MGRIAVFVCFVLLFHAPASAQVSGSINGTTTDDTNAVLPGVTVTAASPSLMGVQATLTNSQGQYRFPTLPPGAYTLTYELAGFSKVVREPIVVNVGFTATVNVQLTIAALEETVTVSTSSPIVDVQNTNIQNNFSAEVMKSIPNARDIWSLIAVTPGTTVERFDVGGSRAGTQTDYQVYGLTGQVRVQIDGANATEETGSAPYVNYGAFDEVQIGTDSNDASMPTPGVQINAVIKSGGNELRGDLYSDYENQSLQGRNVTDELRRVGVGEGSRIVSYYDVNFNLGGPIRRDRFWYFGSVRTNRIGTTVTGFPAENPSDFEFETRLSNGIYKLTYQLNSNNKISHWTQLSQKLQPFRDAQSIRFMDAVYKQNSVSLYSGAEWHQIVSPTYFHSIRVSTWGLNWPNFPYGVNGELGENLRPRMHERVSTIQAGGAIANRTRRRRWQMDWQGVLYKDSFLGGNHAVKMGYVGEVETQKTVDDGYLDELRLRFDSPASAPYTVPWRIELYNTPVTRWDKMAHQGAYLQDQISIGSSLTLNAGIRWDYYRVYHPEQNIQEGRFHDFFYAGAPLPNGFSIPANYADFIVPGITSLTYRDSFGPRISAAYDVRGDGKTVLKANWGRYYHNPGPRDDDNPVRRIFNTFGWNDRNGDRLFTLDELGNFVSASGGVTTATDPNIGHPYTDDISVRLERELGQNLSGRVGFVYKKQNNLYENVEQNRVASLYTLPVTVADPGRDGLRGTADDGPPFTVFDIPPGIPLPSNLDRFETPSDFDEDFKTVEVAVNKRLTDKWSVATSYHYTWRHTLLFDHAENPNEALFNEQNTSDWSFKLFGTYRAPADIVVTPLVRHQSGDPLLRVVSVALRSDSDFEYTAEPPDANRIDNVTLFDLRVEKRFRLPRDHQLGLFLDAFNLTNSHAAEAADDETGRSTTTIDGQLVEFPSFLRPTIILNPRIFRFGVKYSF